VSEISFLVINLSLSFPSFDFLGCMGLLPSFLARLVTIISHEVAVIGISRSVVPLTGVGHRTKRTYNINPWERL
jgi:hypothetical protein